MRFKLARDVFADRLDLEAEGYPFVEIERGRWRIDRTRLISEVKVNLHEALTLYLATRKTARQTRFRHPHAASGMDKLAANRWQNACSKRQNDSPTAAKTRRRSRSWKR
ncbi:hypothetical protein GWK36_08050 [Caldichromatium japonicum]|uniref:Uncharacterized protein n=1 Tax=Caldichromatium japonicum TaxID=2699430 RepID=A0A6G7VCZ2_9GAMM|nr:hypothetical protein [Caldichromatium japonicum]QIK37943.1 hypothetical protein GWK36_08050 [Caldichromatium japonicum]